MKSHAILKYSMIFFYFLSQLNDHDTANAQSPFHSKAVYRWRSFEMKEKLPSTLWLARRVGMNGGLCMETVYGGTAFHALASTERG